MANTKSIVLILTILFTVFSPLLFPANAQVSIKPSIPEFTAKYVDHSYNTATTYKTDPYTGQQVIDKFSEHVDNRTIEVTIRNQPFMPYNDSNGNTINIFYDVRHKGSFAGNWTNMFGGQTQMVWFDYSNPIAKYGYPIQDYPSQTTTIVYQLTNAPANGQIDIQVEALEGYTTSYADGHIMFSIVTYTFYGQESGWSETQTVTFGNTVFPSPTFSPIQTSTPQPTFSTPTFTPNTPTLTPQAATNSIPLSMFVVVVGVLLVIIVVLSIILVVRQTGSKKHLIEVQIF